MIPLFFALLAADPFAGARRDIDTFCKREPGCVEYQRRELAAYVRMMVAFRDPGHRNAERCMRAGKRGQMINWTVSANCMRLAVKGRRLGQ